MKVLLAAVALAWSMTGCPDRQPGTPDATLPRDVLDAPPSDAADGEVIRVRTCSEFSLDAIAATPGRGMRAYPGSQLVLRGEDLGSVDRVVVGGIEMPFTHAGATLVTEVPPMLAAGPQAVTIGTERCLTSLEITVSRLVARAQRDSGRITLLDILTFEPAGTLDTGLGPVVQAAFTMDGAALLVRDASGSVKLCHVSNGRSALVATRSNGPFTLAQGSVVPTTGLVVVPTPSPAGLLRIDTVEMSARPYEGPANDPVGVSTTLDGFRALVLDRSSIAYALDLPFAAVPRWVRFGELAGVTRPAAILMAQGGPSGLGPFACVYDDTVPPAILPISAESGQLGDRLEVPGAAGNLYFLLGDVVVTDTTTNEIIAADITTLTGEILRVPVPGEDPAGIVRTHSAVTLYMMGVLVLRARDGGEPEADVLHLLDWHVEPPPEIAQVRIPGARGLVGVAGAGDPFLVWTARSIVYVQADRPTDLRRAELPAGDPDIVLLALQR